MAEQAILYMKREPKKSSKKRVLKKRRFVLKRKRRVWEYGSALRHIRPTNAPGMALRSPDEHDKLVERYLPNKRKKSDCAELRRRLSQLNAVNAKSAVRTSQISKEIPGARAHLLSMLGAGLVGRTTKRSRHFVLDTRNAKKVKSGWNKEQITLIKKENVNELMRHTANSKLVKAIVLEVAAVKETELEEKLMEDDVFYNKIVDAITEAGFQDNEYAYQNIMWRNMATRWYLLHKII